MTDKKKRKKQLVIIDGNAIIHRSFHALPPFKTKQGELVNAVYGFASTLISVMDKFDPEYIVTTFDLKGPTFRHKKFKEYKATRVKAPDELYAQIERVKEVARAFNIPIYEKEGFEADDLIGTIARKVESRKLVLSELVLSDDQDDRVESIDIETIIVTGDLDTLQLVNKNTKVWMVSRGVNKAVLYGEKEVQKRYELTSEQMIDLKSLKGDASDNIPGVKGIGEKGAINLLKKYQTLENIYENIEEIKGALGEKLRIGKKDAFLSKELGTIDTDVKIDFKLEECLTKNFDQEKVLKLFTELGFSSLIKRVASTKGEQYEATNKKDSNRLGEKFRKRSLLEEEKSVAKRTALTGEVRPQGEIFKDIEMLLKILKKENNIVLASDDESIAITIDGVKIFFIEFNDKNFEKLKSALEDAKIKKTGWQLKNDYKRLKQRGINLSSGFFDVMLAVYILNSGSKIELEKIIAEELGETWEEETKGQISLDVFSEKKSSEKLCQKVSYIWRLREIFTEKFVKEFKDTKMEEVFEKIELPLIPVLAEMELNGIRINKLVFAGVAEKISERVEKLWREIRELAGEDFNVNSTQQLRKILFEKLQLSTQGIKKTKTGFSTAVAELEKLKDQHKIIEKIQKYRELFKLKTTYLDPLPLLADENSRIHSTFNQAVTATGRLSSENPNLQNIPIRTDLGKIIRTAFEAEEGNILISADYSQIDLRVMAHMSGDKKMTEAFWANEDIHTKTASEVAKVSISQVTKKMRSQAKALNFGVIYGMGSFGFAQSAGISVSEAKEFIAGYMKNFSQVAEFIKQIRELAHKDGFVETETGRRRYLPEINSPNFQIQAGAERMAINLPIQGLAADIMKLAMIAVHNYILKSKVKIAMVLQVHDEIILEVKEKDAKKIALEVKQIMEKVYKLKVPLVVDTKIGKTWGEL